MCNKTKERRRLRGYPSANKRKESLESRTCKYCGRVFAFQSGKIVHIKNTHLLIEEGTSTPKLRLGPVRPHRNPVRGPDSLRCKICYRTFRYASEKCDHYRKEHDQVPWTCRYCDLTYWSQSSRRNHEKLKHQDQLSQQKTVNVDGKEIVTGGVGIAGFVEAYKKFILESGNKL